VQGNHWVAGIINFTKQTIGYGGCNLSTGVCFPSLIRRWLMSGDSLAGLFPPLNKLLGQVQKWLREVYGTSYKLEGDILNHGDQNDSFSCGIIMANTIVHAAFNVPIWIPRQAVQERVQWFIKLSESVWIPPETNQEPNKQVSYREYVPSFQYLRFFTGSRPQMFQTILLRVFSISQAITISQCFRSPILFH
jgi:hypothetical protein